MILSGLTLTGQNINYFTCFYNINLLKEKNLYIKIDI